MLQWLKERFQQDELFFVKEVDPDFIERKNIKSVLLHLAQKGLLEHVETGIYSFPGAEFTKKKILNEALLNRRGIQIGHYFGKTFGAILGLCEEPDCLEVASNTQGEATAREKVLYGIKVRIRLPKRPVTPNNYKVLAAFDFLHNSGKYCTAGKKEVHAAICRYLWDAPFSEYRHCGEATKISVNSGRRSCEQ